MTVQELRDELSTLCKQGEGERLVVSMRHEKEVEDNYYSPLDSIELSPALDAHGNLMDDDEDDPQETPYLLLHPAF